MSAKNIVKHKIDTIKDIVIDENQAGEGDSSDWTSVVGLQIRKLP